MRNREKVIHEFGNWCEAMADECPVICLHVLDLLEEQEAEIGTLNRFVNGFSRDAMPVVRCKDCKYAHKTYDGDCKYCDMFTDDDGNPIERYRSGDWFCADGERRTE